MKNIMFTIAATVVLTVTAHAQTRKTVPPTKMVTPSYQLIPGSSWGQAFQNEFELNLSEGYFKTYKIGSKSYTDFNIFGAYSYDLGQNIQVGGDVGLRSYDSSTRLTLVATGTYNMDANYAEAVFFKAGLGLYPIEKGVNGNSDIKNEFGLYVAGGKRFKLWDHVNYKPMVKIAKISDLDAEITIQFLNISLNWN